MVQNRSWIAATALAATLFCSAWTGSCSSQAAQAANKAEKPKTPPAKLVGDQGPSILALPKLSEAAAPSWVKPGLRLTYKVQTATIAGTGADWKEDENGGWKTEDGKRWSPSEKGSNAAEGYLQLDVVAISDDICAVLASFYLVSKPYDPPKLAFSYPVIGYAANAGGFWVNPSELKQAKNTVTPGLKVLRMPYTIHGSKRDAVWIQSLSERGNTMYVYDEQTGVLLHDAVASEGKQSPVIGPNEVSNTPSTTLAYGTLVSQRAIAYPWLVEDATAWSSSPKTLRYYGTTTVPVSGGTPLQLGQELVATPHGDGRGWVHYAFVLTTKNTMGMPPQTAPSQTVSGLGQFGGAYIPPAALKALKKASSWIRTPSLWSLSTFTPLRTIKS